MRRVNVFGALREKLFGTGTSKSAAKSRLQFVLVQDRAGLNGEDMKMFREELMEVIDRYFEVHKEGFDVSYQKAGETTTLLINSPVVVKRDVPLNKSADAKQRSNKKRSPKRNRAGGNRQVKAAGNA